jgi:hypothetical protein
VYFDEKGRRVGTSRKGFLAKAVYWDVDGKRNITVYDDFVGESCYENGRRIAKGVPGLLGTSYTIRETEKRIPEEEVAWETEYEDDVEEENEYGDDIEEETEYDDDIEEEAQLTQQTVITNIVQFVICLLLFGLLVVGFTILKR